MPVQVIGIHRFTDALDGGRIPEAASYVEEYEDKFALQQARNLEKRIESLLTAASQRGKP